MNKKKVALSFWWTATERQVRVQGDATGISAAQADKYFAERERSAQIVSIVSEQGKEIENIDELNKRYRKEEDRLEEKAIKRPGNWGGFSIKPIRIEFMEFKPTRFHDRRLYELNSGQWVLKQLQP